MAGLSAWQGGFLLLTLGVAIVASESEELKPGNVTVTSYTTESITLSWVAAVDEGVWYQIWFWPVNASMDLAMATTIHNSFTIVDLLPGEMYNIWLLGIKGNSTSEYVTIKHSTSMSSPTITYNLEILESLFNIKFVYFKHCI